MVRRRQIILGSGVVGVLGAVATGLAGCSSSAGEQDAAHVLRRPLAANTGDPVLRLRELVRLATLAPSSHNTQCWHFQLQDRALAITPDLSRRCAVVDPDDHHLYVSLGCATENLAHAALAAGLQPDIHFDPAAQGTSAHGSHPPDPAKHRCSAPSRSASAPVGSTMASRLPTWSFACLSRQAPARGCGCCC